MTNEIFSYPFIIRESHLDTFGHVNNAMYLTILEEARWEFITKNGFGMKKIQETGLGPTILEIKVTFFKELRLREKIVIESQVLSYEGKIAKLLQQIFRDGELCCSAEMVMAFFNIHERKIILPTQEWLVAVGVNSTN